MNIKKYVPIFKRISICIIFWAFLWYIGFLLINSKTIVQWNYADQNIVFYILLILIWLWFFIWFGVMQLYFKKIKLYVAIVWIFLLIVWEYVFLWHDTQIETKIYISDITKILWVFITILSPMNFFYSNDKKKKVERKNAVIIDA